jgi:hypothetical protein
MKTFHIIIHLRGLSPIGLFVQSENETDAMRITWASVTESDRYIIYADRQQGEFLSLADIMLDGEPLKALCITNPENVLAIQSCGELMGEKRP